MVDNSITGANWCELPAGSYSLRKASGRTSRCQIEADIVYEELVSHSGERG